MGSWPLTPTVSRSAEISKWIWIWTRQLKRMWNCLRRKQTDQTDVILFVYFFLTNVRLSNACDRVCKIVMSLILFFIRQFYRRNKVGKNNLRFSNFYYCWSETFYGLTNIIWLAKWHIKTHLLYWVYFDVSNVQSRKILNMKVDVECFLWQGLVLFQLFHCCLVS